MSNEGFVVKAVGPEGTDESWLTTPRRGGHRTFGPRDLAALFVNWDQAAYAVNEMRQAESCSGITFEIHTVKPDG